MKVRRFQTSDEKAITQMFSEAFESYIETLPDVYDYRPITADSLLEIAKSDNSDIWVVETADRAVGFVQCEVVFEESVKTVLLSVVPKDLGQSAIAVSPKYQRQGYGRFLMGEVLEHYRSNGTKIAVGLTYDDNFAGESFLQSLGFVCHDVFQLKFQTKPMANSTICARVSLKTAFATPTSNLDITFRGANEGDAESVAYIHEKNVWWCDECSTPEWSWNYIKGKFGHRVIVVEYNGRVIGSADYIRSNGRIGLGGVLPEYQRQGVGSALFATLLNAMRADGFESAFVDSGLTQEEAIRMYERFGFQMERKQNCWIRILIQDLE
jgi:ribosomal protein S18 acetylase RimI-like enzyme